MQAFPVAELEEIHLDVTVRVTVPVRPGVDGHVDG